MIQQLVKLMGQPINSPEMKAFFEEYGFKYPAKDTQSVRGDSPTLYLCQRKLGMDLLFETKAWHPLYPPVPSDRRGVFYYRLREVQFTKQKTEDKMLDYIGVEYDSTLDKLKNKFGEPLKEFKNDESGTRYFWRIAVAEQKGIVANLNYQNQTISDIWMTIPSTAFFDELPTPEFLSVVGKPINAPEVKAFIEKYGGVYPTKDTISTAVDPASGRTAYDREKIAQQYFDLQLHGLPGGLLVFSLKETGVFSPVAVQKKDHYYPVLQAVFFNNDHENGVVKYPKGVTSADSLDTLREKLGKPIEESGGSCLWRVLFENDSIEMPIQYWKLDEYGIDEKVCISVNPEKSK